MKIDLLTGTLAHCDLVRLRSRDASGMISAVIARGFDLDQYAFVLASPARVDGACLSGFVVEMCNQGLSPERTADIVEQASRTPYASFSGMIRVDCVRDFVKNFLPTEGVAVPTRVTEVLATPKRNTVRAVVWDGARWHAEYVPVNTNPNATTAMVN